MTDTNLSKALASGLQQLNVEIAAPAQKKMLAYMALLQKWNKAYNLTAVDDPVEMVTRHLLDCAAALPYLGTESPVLDVGSGAGLPGLVFAIVRPEQQFFLLDSLGKRTIFLEKVIRDLKLSNVNVLNTRVETYQSDAPFAIITSRAFSSLKLFVDGTLHLADKNTAYLALKGRNQPDEINEISKLVTHLKIHKLDIPHLGAERHIVNFKLAII